MLFRREDGQEKKTKAINSGKSAFQKGSILDENGVCVDFQGHTGGRQPQNQENASTGLTIDFRCIEGFKPRKNP